MRCPWLPDFPRRQQAVAKLFSRKRTQHRTFRPRIESLEDRLVPAVITVTGTGDTIAIDGLATLREAITSINNQADVNADVTLNRVGLYASLPGGTPDVINFNIAGAGVKMIAVTGTGEPTIIRPLTINGYSEILASANTLANADNAVILIQLDGTGTSAGADGLTLGAGSGGSTIKGLDITNFPGNGIVVQSNGNFILGNFIGVDPTGTTRMPNGAFPNSGDGIRILNASNNQIGSTGPADRNITSGNAVDGIHVEGTLTTPATGNIIQGNFVGVAADGKSSVGNRTEPAPAPGAAEGNNLFGIEISGGNLNTVGGIAAGARNVVGFNGVGIELANGAQQNIIQGNFSGVGADGVTPAANLLQGIVLRSSNGFGPPLGPAQPNEPGVSFNIIGGTAAGAGNLVEFNGTAGIAIFGNPVSASGQPNIGNAIEGNNVFQNGRSFQTASSAPTPLLGIDLTNQFAFPREDGLTANDSKGHGAANDPNNFQNFPVLTSAFEDSTGKTHINGTLHSDPNHTYRIEFFANDPDPLNLPAEGQQFLGFVNTTTDASGNANFSATLNVAVASNRTVTATATDPIGNTSEFSAAVVVTFPRVAFALSSVDQQIYTEVFSSQGKAVSGWSLAAPGRFTALAVGSVGADAGPMVFALGVDQHVYAARFNPDGSLVNGWFLVAPGQFTSLAVGQLGTVGDRPIVFGVGVDRQAYGAAFNAGGGLDHGWFHVAPGEFSSLTAGQFGAAGNPELFGVGIDHQAYAARLDTSGNLLNGFFQVAPGGFTSLSVGARGAGRQELFGIGLDEQVYAATLNASGNLAMGWFATAPGHFLTLAVVTLGNGNVGVYGLNSAQQFLTGSFAASTGAQLSGWTQPTPGSFSALGAHVTPTAISLVLAIDSSSGSIFSAIFDADNNPISGFLPTAPGAFRRVALAP